jgi:hypothetical protein
MNINVEMLIRSQRGNKLSCSSRRRRIIIGKTKTRVGFRMTDRARRTGRTISRSSGKTIVPTGTRNTRGKETRTSRVRTDILSVSSVACRSGVIAYWTNRTTEGRTHTRHEAHSLDVSLN